MDGVPECSCPAEALLRRFYAWEQRGRGWQVHETPVRPEPAFQPFRGHFIEAPAPKDDGRKPTFLSSVTQSLGSLFSSPPQSPVRLPPPLPPTPTEAPPRDLVELTIQLSQDATPEMASFEQLLVGLGGCHKPLCFELIGDGKTVLLQLVVDEVDAARCTSRIGGMPMKGCRGS